MTKQELAEWQLKENYKKYGFDTPIEDLKWSGELLETTLNDGTVEVVDRLIEFSLCSLYSYYYIDRYCWTIPSNGGPIPLKLFYFQKDALSLFQKYSKIIFRKCLTEDNYIQTDRGLISIKEAKVGDKILTLKDGIPYWDEIVDFWKNKEEQEVIKIHQYNGNMLECSLDHPIMTTEGWKEARDIKKNDELISSFEKQSFGDFELESDELAKLIGYYTADGKARRTHFTNTNRKYAKEVFEASKLFDDIKPRMVTHIDTNPRHKKYGYSVSMSNGDHSGSYTSSYLRFADRFNFGKIGKERFFSEETMNINKRQMSILLNRLYAGDGWASIGHHWNTAGVLYDGFGVGIGMPNKKFAYQVQNILGRYGIKTAIKYEDRFWRVYTVDKYSTLKFAKEIGIHDKIDNEFIERLEDSIGAREKNPSKVGRIRPQGKKTTYDITTKTGTFLANGILVHNCRQVGATVLSGCYALWRANFQKSQMVKIISLKIDDAREFKEKTIDLNYLNMPGFLKTAATRDGNNRTTLKLKNGSSIKILPKSKNAGRGGTPSLVIIDEAAFNEWMDQIWKSVEPSLDKGGDIIIISTTNGVGNWYHLTYSRAETGENEFYPIYIPWWKYPGRDNPWLDDVLQGKIPANEVQSFVEVEELRQLAYEGDPRKAPWLWKRRHNAKNEKDFHQEILAEFIGSGDTVTTPKTIMRLEMEKRDPNWADRLPNGEGPHPGLWCWQDRKDDRYYMLTADTATGHGRDFSAFQVMDVFNREQVAEFKYQIPTDSFGMLIKKTARYYNHAFVIVETNHPGPATFNEIYKSRVDPYPNVFVQKRGKELVSWETTSKTRVKLIEAYFRDLENGSVHVYSSRLLEEIKTFIWSENDKPEAMESYNDDLVMALAMFCLMKDKQQTGMPMIMSSSYSKATEYSETMPDLVWAERERQIGEMYGVSLEDWYWVSGHKPPEEYIKMRERQKQDKEEIPLPPMEKPPEWLKKIINKEK
jgi:Intein splicing domain/Terminase large subunit, T4likevirus-type, N-terminal/LAGLIDADG-like domain